LAFFKTVTVDTVEVPGTSDLVDVDFEVEEQPSGSIGMQVGFAQGSGLVLGANVQQNNWLGSGKQVGFNVNSSKYQNSASFNYNDPYFTVDGVSRGFSVFYTKRDFSEVNVSSYTTDTYGANLSFGYPMSETSRVGFTAGWRDLTITTGDFAVQEIVSSPKLYPGFPEQYVTWSDLGAVDPSADYSLNTLPIQDTMLSDNPAGFIDENGDHFSGFLVSLNWSESTLNRGVLATRGRSQRVSAEISLPGTELEYYKLQYNAQYFQPLTKSLTLRLRTDLGYADAYGKTTEVPFFENFYAGGFGSVRGFERNSLGPRSTPPESYQTVASTNTGRNDSYVLCDTGSNCTPGKLVSNRGFDDDDPFGGNVLVEGSAEILFPLPWIKDQSAFQAAFFVDAGNVFDSNCGEFQRNCSKIDLNKLSSSYGLGLTWISGFGPMTFSIAKPLKKNEFDEVESFQFSMGNTF
jgi:outer membrane protein insertion porin family